METPAATCAYVERVRSLRAQWGFGGVYAGDGGGDGDGDGNGDGDDLQRYLACM